MHTKQFCSQAFRAFPGMLSERDYDRFHKTGLKKAHPHQFAPVFESLSLEMKKHIIPLKNNPRWGTIIYYKLEKSTLKNEPNPVWRLNEGMICLDVNSSHAGNIYLMEEGEIYAKFLVLSFWRPLHIFLKTLYHASGAGVAKTIYDSVKTKKSIGYFAQRTVRSLLDIVRTPLYGLVIEIVTLTALIITPFKFSMIHDFRAFVGQLSHELYWGKRFKLPWDCSPCMRRNCNLVDLVQRKQLGSLKAAT